MSINIRKGVHHTNSSSVHAIAIHTSHMNAAPLEPEYSDDRIHVALGEFGWGFDRYDDLYTKLSYLLTLIKMTEYREKFLNVVGDCEDCNWYDEIDQEIFQNTYGFYLLDSEIERYCGYHIAVEDPNGLGSIDHQSCDFKSLEDFLEFWAVDLHNFLFDTAYELWISNDDGGRLPTDAEIATFENANWYVKGSSTLLNVDYYKGRDVDIELDSSDSGSFDTARPEGRFLDEDTVYNCIDDCGTE